MQYQDIAALCLDRAQGPAPRLLDLAEDMMALASVPMHGPVHHYIVPAALLTVASWPGAPNPARLKEQLYLAMDRAEKVLPGFCGLWGCCGAAVGCGIFASIWLDANPRQEQHWGAVNAFTARCLDSIAAVGGPRCCKRVMYLALTEAVRQAPLLLGLDLGPVPAPVCHRWEQNDLCRKERCPFFPAPAPAATD